MKLCEYGCGQEAKHQFKNGRWCCSKNYQSCPTNRRKYSRVKIGKIREPFSEEHKRKMSEAKIGKICSEETKRRIGKSMKGKNTGPRSEETKRKMSESQKLTIKKINKKYPLFSKIEEMRYNPDKPKEKEIQIHCKNHECENSKEKSGWFTPTKSQLYERVRNLNSGADNSYFYCSQHCKDTCPLYGLQSDPYKTNNKPYTSGELDVFNKHILKRDNEICYYCGNHHATIVHHLRPQKLQPFFALDPDYAISVCIKCHYKYGHPTGSKHSTGNLAKIVCSVESQKFLNQK